MRLIAATGSQGTYLAAAEIRLAPKALTYWRDPGEAGVPPKFSFDGSDNLASSDVLFPAPSRIDEQGIIAFGYRGGVIFPIRVQARDATKPVRLVVTLDYAVCENICLPVRSKAELVLSQTGDNSQAATIATAEARVPQPLTAGEIAEDVSISPAAASKPKWLVAWKGDAPASDLFIEAPDGWAFETRRQTDNLFSLVAVQNPPSAAAQDIPVRITVTGASKAHEFTANLRFRPPALAPSPGQAAGSK